MMYIWLMPHNSSVVATWLWRKLKAYLVDKADSEHDGRLDGILAYIARIEQFASVCELVNYAAFLVHGR